MKNSSTAACAALCTATLAAALGLLPATATAQESTVPAAPAAPANCAFLPNAPDQHLVVRGDTLWDIAGKFLQNPWCWPQVWGLNKDQIRDPHWIYPGQIVYFDRNAGRLRLGTPVGGAPVAEEPSGTVRLIPQVRNEPLSRQAIPAIRAEKIAPFLARPLVIEEKDFNGAPVIVAAQEGRVFLGRGDQAFVRGELGSATTFQAFRPGKALRDPDTGKVLALEARYLGALKLERAARAKDEAHRFVVSETAEEMGTGDRLVVAPATPVMNFVPHPPAGPVNARIMSLYGEGAATGSNSVVTINRGSADGLDIGTVLDVTRAGKVIPDRTNGNKGIRLPDNKVGTLLVFRVYDRLAYGLIMNATDAIVIGDLVRAPD